MNGKAFVCVGVVAGFAAMLVPPSVAAAANVLANPGFENFHDNLGPRPDNWVYFGNTFSEAMFFAHAGSRVEKFFGNWSGPWNASGVFQVFPSTAGDIWEIDTFAYHWSGDPLPVDPVDPALNNRLIMKIEFQDAGGGMLGFSEAVIVDPNTPQDVWIDVPALQATAPPATAQVLAVFVFLQPDIQGGSAWIDDASFVLIPEPATVGLLTIGGLVLVHRRRR